MESQKRGLKNLGISQRGNSMAPGSKVGNVKEIEVAQPNLKISKELKQKLETMNQFSHISNAINRLQSHNSSAIE